MLVVFSKRFIILSVVCILCASANAMAVVYAKNLPRVMVFKIGSSPRPSRYLDRGRHVARTQMRQRYTERRRPNAV